VGFGRQAEDEDAGGRVSEAGYGTRPVIAGQIGSALLASDAFAILDETRAESAGCDFGFEDGQSGAHGRSVNPGFKVSRVQSFKVKSKYRLSGKVGDNSGCPTPLTEGGELFLICEALVCSVVDEENITSRLEAASVLGMMPSSGLGKALSVHKHRAQKIYAR
jgi:hypothetical protein